MSEYIHKSHNVSVLMYHFVCAAKYIRAVFDSKKVDTILKTVCQDIEKRYEISFLEIGSDQDHVHFLIQSIPEYSPTKIIRAVKSITAREIFKQAPEVKKMLWGGEFWSKGYFVSTVSKHGDESVISRYVKNQGKEVEYEAIYQPSLFDTSMLALR